MKPSSPPEMRQGGVRRARRRNQGGSSLGSGHTPDCRCTHTCHQLVHDQDWRPVLQEERWRPEGQGGVHYVAHENKNTILQRRQIPSQHPVDWQSPDEHGDCHVDDITVQALPRVEVPVRSLCNVTLRGKPETPAQHWTQHYGKD